MNKNVVKIGLMGLGNIGVGTYLVLEKERETIKKNTGVDFEIVKVLEKYVDRVRPVNVPLSKFTQDPDEIFNDPEIDVVIELLGGLHPATDFMLRAMEHGKHVVTANKAAVAHSYELLRETAEKNNVMFRYEASVGGAIPVLTALTNALQANTFEGVYGILNGTTNYILTQMTDFDMSYEEALQLAKDKGFAEPDPTADVEGHDAANKLSILIALCFGERVRPSGIPTRGITRVTKEDIVEAAKEGYKIKLVASAQMVDGKLEYSVKPTKLPFSHPLASVSNELNAVYVQASEAGELMFYGRGAGPLPTGSAVMGDVIEIGKAIKKNAAYDLVVAGGKR